MLHSLFPIPYSLFACSRGLLAALGGGAALDDAHDVGLLHDQEIFAIDLYLGARPFAEQHDVAGLPFGRDALAGIVERTRADGDDFAFLRLLLGGLGDADAAGGLLLFLHAAAQHA